MPAISGFAGECSFGLAGDALRRGSGSGLLKATGFVVAAGGFGEVDFEVCFGLGSGDFGAGEPAVVVVEADPFFAGEVDLDSALGLAGAGFEAGGLVAGFLATGSNNETRRLEQARA